MNWAVYLITNKANGKGYVGISNERVKTIYNTSTLIKSTERRFPRLSYEFEKKKEPGQPSCPDLIARQLSYPHGYAAKEEFGEKRSLINKLCLAKGLMC